MAKICHALAALAMPSLKKRLLMLYILPLITCYVVPHGALHYRQTRFLPTGRLCLSNYLRRFGLYGLLRYLSHEHNKRK
ncbi:hypothetical protein BJ912DRAFT_615962 [Pholiota molesta]|nr:hypothetical protein BJ912DRAFT_615962 [Pholiota molesta]